MMVELNDKCWRRSSYSHSNGACVELVVSVIPVPDPLGGHHAST
jgi:hypothetical protein